MYAIVEDCYNVLQAPHKELTWLDGGHGLEAQQPEPIHGCHGEKVLAEAVQLKSERKHTMEPRVTVAVIFVLAVAVGIGIARKKQK